METNNVAAILASTVIKRLRWGSRAFSIIPKVKLFNLWLEIQSALGCCWYFTFCRKNVAAADWYSQQQNDEDYFIMRQKRIAYVHFSLFRISIYLNFMPNFSVKIFVGSCGGGRAVHLKYTVFICLFEYDGFWVIKVSDLSVFLKFWLNFSFWILWYEIPHKSRACMENITFYYPQNLLKS